MAMNWKLKLLGAFTALSLVSSSGALFAAEQYHDTRYHMDHYYPARGAAVGALPAGRVPVYDGAHNAYYFHGGVWYRPYGGRFVVVGPPIGVFVPYLPPYYTTLWIGGYPYYYSNDTYYSWNPVQGQYEVVQPPGADAPAGVDGASTEPPAAAGELYSYPKNGQSPEQQEQDRYECHRWAVDQSGFDPTQNTGGPPDPAKRPAYDHAMTACLEGRGYTVK
jgi:hypothetical protein